MVFCPAELLLYFARCILIFFRYVGAVKNVTSFQDSEKLWKSQIRFNFLFFILNHIVAKGVRSVTMENRYNSGSGSSTSFCQKHSFVNYFTRDFCCPLPQFVCCKFCRPVQIEHIAWPFNSNIVLRGNLSTQEKGRELELCLCVSATHSQPCLH